jgi:hypothetical protein
VGQWGRFSQIKHNAHQEPPLCTWLCVRCLSIAKEDRETSDLMITKAVTIRGIVYSSLHFSFFQWWNTLLYSCRNSTLVMVLGGGCDALIFPLLSHALHQVTRVQLQNEA